ncbi:MAG: hypothetical protein PWQ77_1673 [Kosmotogales bacterium]|nr:hypothetical protein [Kosmotogales bacterium]
MKDAYYFSHDSNARNDPKILSLTLKYGVAGYGMFWILLENMRESENYKLEHKQYIYNSLAYQMHVTGEEVETFIKDCIDEFELFKSDGEFFWSESLLKRMDKFNDIREKRKKAAEARWNQENNDNNNEINTQDMQMHNTSNADEMQRDAKKRKENKIKLNNIKLNKIKENEKNPEEEFNAETFFEEKDEELREEDAVLTPEDLYAMDVITLFNKTCTDLPPFNLKNYKLIRQMILWRRHECPNMTDWNNFFKKVHESDFLNNRLPGKDFDKCKLGWLLENKNFLKVLEGNYKNRASPGTTEDLSFLDRYAPKKGGEKYAGDNSTG